MSRYSIARALLMASLALTACGGGGGGSTAPIASPREVRFEVTGTMTGAFVLTHTGLLGAVVTTNITALPQNHDIRYSTTIGVIAVSIAEVNATENNSGKTVRVRVLSGGKEVLTQTASANSIGNVLFRPMTYAFP